MGKKEKKKKRRDRREDRFAAKSIRILFCRNRSRFFDFFFLFGSDHRYACTLVSRTGGLTVGGEWKEKLERR